MSGLPLGALGRWPQARHSHRAGTALSVGEDGGLGGRRSGGEPMLAPDPRGGEGSLTYPYGEGQPSVSSTCVP